MSAAKRGPKTKYTDEVLIAEIMRYAHAHPGCRIQISALAAYTGISKATWHRNKAAMEKIDQLNDVPVIASISSPLPSLSDIKKICNDDPQKYLEVISMLLDMISSLEADHSASDESHMESQLVQQLRLEIKEKDKLIDRLNTRINVLTNQDDKLINIKDNLAKLDSAIFNQQFEEQFGDLFS